jgi:DNA-binding MarR family transcriptional regulator
MTIAMEERPTIEEIATASRVSLRQTYRAIDALHEAGYIVRERQGMGRRHRYELCPEVPLVDRVGVRTVGEFVRALQGQ